MSQASLVNESDGWLHDANDAQPQQCLVWVMVNVRSLSYSDRPYPLTSLIGREWVVADVSALLTRPGVRLVTLTGSGGIGKTRLAVAVAENVPHAFHGGIFFVS